MKLGKYRHFKWFECEILWVAKHSETLEDMIIYKESYGEWGVRIRPQKMFEEFVEIDGKKIPRFEYIGE